MKILLLSDINSAHTQKWAIALSQRGITIAIFSISKPQKNWYSEHSISLLNIPKIKNSTTLSNIFYKFNYIRSLFQLNKIIKQFKPDIVHAHYATSYGLMGALSNFHPLIISAWGTDVMDFPNKSFLHKKLLSFNLKKADLVLATSNTIEKAISKICNVKTKKIAFGIDVYIFKPQIVTNNFDTNTIVVGTIKSLEQIYGIDILIKAYKLIVTKYSDKSIKLLIIGSGSKEQEYKELVRDLSLQEKVVFMGKIDFVNIPIYHNMIDIFVNVSRNESFGVSVIEASACENPVIASNIGGLKEVVINNETGFLVESEDVNAVADAIEKLLLNKPLREDFGRKGREFVNKYFNLSSNADDLIKIYSQFTKNN